MLNPFMTCLFLLHPGGAAAPLEPPGTHVSGAVPVFLADPIPPAWVRLESHVLADPDCRHYAYEVYAGDTYWLVRYVMFPDDHEEFREIEQVFRYPKEKNRAKVERIKLSELQIEPMAARWKSQTLRLVDRRDLIRD